MTRVHDVLHEVLPNSSVDDWIGGFIGESRPENEVRIFEAIAVVYVELLAALEMTLTERRRLYGTLVMASCGYTMDGIEEGLHPGVPSYSELIKRYERAFAANERPEQVVRVDLH